MRSRGKVHFVIRVALIWGGAMVLGNILLDFLFGGGFSLSNVIYFIIAAPFISLVSWWANEGEYRAAKLDARMKAVESDDLCHGE